METITTTKTDKVILIDSRLLASPLNNSLHNVLSKNHDIVYVDVDESVTPKKQARKISNSVYRLFQKQYQHFVFIGYKDSCELGCELYRQKGLVFNSYIFIDSKVSEQDISDLLKEDVKVLSVEKDKNTHFSPVTRKFFKQTYRTLIPVSYHQRTSKEILGWLTYAVYNSHYLNDSFGTTTKLV